jgi:hypothetical protein
MMNGCRNESPRTCYDGHEEADCFGMWRSEADAGPMAKLRESTMAAISKSLWRKRADLREGIRTTHRAGVVAHREMHAGREARGGEMLRRRVGDS